MESNIWKDIEHDEEEKTVNIITSMKRPLTRANLNLYMTDTPIKDITRETFLDFFEEKTINKLIPGKSYYIIHNIFDDYYSDKQILQLLKFIFEFIPPNQISETLGMNYLMYLFKRPNPLYKETVIKILKQAVDMDVNFGHRDFEWNTVFNWLIVGNGYSDAIVDLYPYFEEEDLEEVANKDGLTCIDLLNALLSFCNLNIEGQKLNVKIEELDALLEKYENVDNRGLIVSLLLEHKKNQNKQYFTFRDKLEIDRRTEDFGYYTIIKEKEEAKIGSYKKKIREK